MKRRANSRRKFVAKCTGAGIIALTGMLVWAGCGKKENSETAAQDEILPQTCDDLSSISESDIALRQKFGYVNESPIPDNQCNNCNLYLPPKEGQKCGGCMLFKGPVYSSAYCTYWAPKL